jgi:hypothetical protein
MVEKELNISALAGPSSSKFISSREGRQSRAHPKK